MTNSQNDKYLSFCHFVVTNPQNDKIDKYLSSSHQFVDFVPTNFVHTKFCHFVIFVLTKFVRTPLGPNLGPKDKFCPDKFCLLSLKSMAKDRICPDKTGFVRTNSVLGPRTNLVGTNSVGGGDRQIRHHDRIVCEQSPSDQTNLLRMQNDNI